jgi:hypothetical protein
MKRALSMIPLVMALGLFVAGCGKKEESGAPGKEPAIGRASDPIAEPDSASKLIGPPDTSDINKERAYASIQDMAADKYIGCEAPVFCGGMAYFDCNEKGGGAGLYYDSAKVAIVSRCGSFCTHPEDAAQKGMCDSLCPPKAWTECRKR